MPKQGWKRLIDGWPWFQGEGTYPIAAYSEFMPPPRLLRKPYGTFDPLLSQDNDRWGWPITEYQEALLLRPGLEKIARQVIEALVHLGEGRPAHGISKGKLANNPYWPRQLAQRAGKLAHERYLVLLSLALSCTQDDKGRVNWTLFGGSEQGPAQAFWKSFFHAPKREVSPQQADEFVGQLLSAVYGEGHESDLRRTGFRILPQQSSAPRSSLPWREGPLPSWTRSYLWNTKESFHGVRYLLTFRPFSELPNAVQQAYLAGRLHLLPFPGSLVFWGTESYFRLQRELPMAGQIPLLHVLTRHEGPHGIRIPQSGWLHEPRLGMPGPNDHHGPVRNSYRRTHRWARVHRDENELDLGGREDKLVHVLFSTAPEEMGLYGKPMARNAQIWDHEFHLLLDGPKAGQDEIKRAFRAIRAGGLFGYRFQFPAMRVGQHEVYWHRPLVAYHSAQTGKPSLFPGAPAGYLTAYRADRPDLSQPLELWPRFLNRELHSEAVELFEQVHNHHPHQTLLNLRKLLETRDLWERDLPLSLARSLLTAAKHETLNDWLNSLRTRTGDLERSRQLVEDLSQRLEPDHPPKQGKRRWPTPLTYGQTAKRSFEITYWKAIRYLAEGKYHNKNNADCVRDRATQAALSHHHRDLEELGNYLIAYYEKTISKTGMARRALVGDLPFHWQTDFEFFEYGGWLSNQEGRTHERDLIVVIPGRDRRRAVIMADHYDTAYMADHYEKESGGEGARIAAAGADDNHSATAALMLAAPIFLELSRQRRLDCDIWLIHLTGEEFPADCLGARHLCQGLVEGTLTMRLPSGRVRDLSKVRIQGAYVLDMVAHNNDRDRDVFQISPGTGRASMWLAYQAHIANEIWNASLSKWNRRLSRRGRERGRRSSDGRTIPDVALYPHLHGEVRPPYEPRSTLYNTDGQIFSDAGIPVVLFMENYDINRCGYHDSHDTMENIDLDYGAAVAAIAIETVARAATEKFSK